MANKKQLLIETLNSGMPHPHGMTVKDKYIKDLSENYFRVETTRAGVEGRPDDKLIGEYAVWTDEEAAADGWKGGVPSTDPKYKIYRIA